MVRSQSVRRWEHPSEHSFWMSLTAEEREAFEDAADERTYGPGTVLCEEGTHSTHAIVIRSGWAKVARCEDDKEQIVTVRGPGDIVGERAALTCRARSASVTALGAVRGLVLPTTGFHDLMMDHPRLRDVLDRQERERTAEDDEQMFRDDPEGMEYRLAYLLCELAFRRGEQTPTGTALNLPMSRKDIARWVDAKRKDVTVVLEAWRRHGVVSTDRRTVTVVDAQGLDDLCRRRTRSPGWSSLNCSILLVDVVGFSMRSRNKSDRAVVRSDLYAILREAFEKSDIPWSAYYHEDRGDGVVLIVPPAIPTRAIADPLIAWLGVGLRRHNHRSGPATSIRLRVAMHVGPVARDQHGLNGDAIIYAARMLDSDLLRDALRDSEADLALMASDHVYGSIQADIGMLDAAAFRKVDFQGKTWHVSAWLHVPATVATPATNQPQAAPSNGNHFHGTVHINGDFVAGHKHVNDPST